MIATAGKGQHGKDGGNAVHRMTFRGKAPGAGCAGVVSTGRWWPSFRPVSPDHAGGIAYSDHLRGLNPSYPPVRD